MSDALHDPTPSTANTAARPLATDPCFACEMAHAAHPIVFLAGTAREWRCDFRPVPADPRTALQPTAPARQAVLDAAARLLDSVGTPDARHTPVNSAAMRRDVELVTEALRAALGDPLPAADTIADRLRDIATILRDHVRLTPGYSQEVMQGTQSDAILLDRLAAQPTLMAAQARDAALRSEITLLDNLCSTVRDALGLTDADYNEATSEAIDTALVEHRARLRALDRGPTPAPHHLASSLAAVAPVAPATTEPRRCSECGATTRRMKNIRAALGGYELWLCSPVPCGAVDWESRALAAEERIATVEAAHRDALARPGQFQVPEGYTLVAQRVWDDTRAAAQMHAAGASAAANPIADPPIVETFHHLEDADRDAHRQLAVGDRIQDAARQGLVYTVSMVAPYAVWARNGHKTVQVVNVANWVRLSRGSTPPTAPRDGRAR